MSTKRISPQDRALFRQSVGKVRPVSHDKLHLTRPPAQRKPGRPEDYEPVNAVDLPTTQVGSHDSLSFVSPGLRKNVLRQLRRGFFDIEAELDLHGLKTHEAHRILTRFLQGCVQDRLYCIHIIHGKGYRSMDRPILKNELNHWLRQHPDVLAFCSASPHDGGTGALYVLLALR